MASSHAGQNCWICREAFTDPRRLPCHTFCLRCIEAIVNVDAQTVRCPRCQREHAVPSGGPQAFMPDDPCVLDENQHENQCTDCKKFEDVSTCPHCNHPICGTCKSSHMKKLELFGLIFTELKKIEESVPNGNIRDRLRERKNELIAVTEHVSTEEEELESSFKQRVDGLEKRKNKLLKKLRKPKQLAETQLTSVDNALAAPDFHKQARALLEKRGQDVDMLVPLYDQCCEVSKLLAGLEQNLLGDTVPELVEFRQSEQPLRAGIVAYGEVAPPLPPYQGRKVLATIDGSASGLGTFDGVYDVAISSAGEIYTAAKGHCQKYTRDGQFVHHWQLEGQFACPFLALHSDGNLLVSDNQDHSVYVYSVEGQLIRSFGAKGGGDGQLLHPCGVTTDQDNVYVADSNNGRVQIFSHTGQFIRTVGRGVLGSTKFLAFNNKGQLLVSDENDDAVYTFDPRGALIAQFNGDGGNDLQEPRGICTDARGNVLVVNKGRKRIDVFDPAMKYQCSIADPNEPFDNPYGIAVSHDGRIAVADHARNKVMIF